MRDVGVARVALPAEQTSWFAGLRDPARDAEHLRDSHPSVASIAAKVGCASEAAFNRAFRRVVGVPPAARRREARSG